MAGHLAIMQNALHFFGKFLVEGTGGSSVFNNFQDLRNSDSSKYDQMGGNQKEKLQKGSINLDADHGKENAVDIMDSDASKYNEPNKIKRHRRWNVSKVCVAWNPPIVIFHSQ